MAHTGEPQQASEFFASLGKWALPRPSISKVPRAQRQAKWVVLHENWWELCLNFVESIIKIQPKSDKLSRFLCYVQALSSLSSGCWEKEEGKRSPWLSESSLKYFCKTLPPPVSFLGPWTYWIFLSLLLTFYGPEVGSSLLGLSTAQYHRHF